MIEFGLGVGVGCVVGALAILALDVWLKTPWPALARPA